MAQEVYDRALQIDAGRIGHTALPDFPKRGIPPACSDECRSVWSCIERWHGTEDLHPIQHILRLVSGKFSRTGAANYGVGGADVAVGVGMAWQGENAGRSIRIPIGGGHAPALRVATNCFGASQQRMAMREMSKRAIARAGRAPMSVLDGGDIQ